MSRAARAVAATALLVAGLVLSIGAGAEIPRAVARASRTGWLAAVLLCSTLAIRPLSAFAPRLRAWRRALGLATATAGAAHLTLIYRDGWLDPLTVLLTEPMLRSGSTVALILSALTVTSFPRVVRAARLGHWRLLHRLVYVAPLFVWHHVALSPHVLRAHLYALGVALFALLLARTSPPRRTPTDDASS